MCMRTSHSFSFWSDFCVDLISKSQNLGACPPNPFHTVMLEHTTRSQERARSSHGGGFQGNVWKIPSSHRWS